MGWKKDTLKSAAAVSVLAGAFSAAVTFIVPRNEIPVVGSVGRTVLRYTPLGVGHVPGVSLMSEIYYGEMEADREYRKKIMKASPSEIANMDVSEREAREAYIADYQAVTLKMEQAEQKSKVIASQLRASQESLQRTQAMISVGEKDAEQYALDRGFAISLVDADQIVGSLYTEHHLIDVSQMTKLAEVIQAKGSIVGSPEIMSRPEYENVKQNSVYQGLPIQAQRKLDELILPKLGF